MNWGKDGVESPAPARANSREKILHGPQGISPPVPQIRRASTGICCLVDAFARHATPLSRHLRWIHKCNRVTESGGVPVSHVYWASDLLIRIFKPLGIPSPFQAHRPPVSYQVRVISTGFSIAFGLLEHPPIAPTAEGTAETLAERVSMAAVPTAFLTQCFFDVVHG